jgi:alpha-amylase/alpha-mannosidase (GH57 family)
MTERYVCIHGHFYQPPRENPWLETVEVQDSAYPYHDWNERVTAECYAPNAASRILDEAGRIARIVNNYARISFDFGPTLLAWMEAARPEVYRAVLEADRRSAKRFGGHGSAMAQAHGHLILPLAVRRDKETQVIWGLRDFERRFGRPAEGMWLPETAVDVESLEVLAENGVRFTVLAPHQAARVRPLCHDERGGDTGQGDERPWQEVDGGAVDPTRPYLCRLPSGRSIGLFFYDGALSQDVAFGDLLRDGETFARRLLAAFPEAADGPALVHIATDGETYGHHHRYGEMALSFALDRLARTEGVRVTNYGELLERRPPRDEVEIRQDTSWSCVHGVERWRSDCGCATGGEPGWHQRWRAPLREALDWLRDELAPRYEEAAGELLRDPWAARNGYVDVVLDRSEEAVERFLAEHAARELSAEERVRARRLLELQRHAMTMFTSCGWFFNDLAGIETVQVLQYADRALQLAHLLFGDSFEERFLERLERAESNRPAPYGGTGREIFERQVRPARVDLVKVGAHYALSSLFEDYPEEARIFSYRADQREVHRRRSGRAQLAVGRLRVASLVTGAEAELSFAVLHLGDQNLSGGVREHRGPEAFEAMRREVTAAFERAELPRVLRLLDRHFDELTYTLDSLFRDERRVVLDLILAPTRAEAEEQHRRVYGGHASLMDYLAQLGIPLPLALKASAEVVLDLDLRRALADPEADLEAVERRLRETAAWGLDLDTPGLSHALEASLEALARGLEEQPDDAERLVRLRERVELARALPFQASLSGAQNAWWRLLQGEAPVRRAAAEAGGEGAGAWLERFRALGESLGMRVDRGA